MPFMKFRKVVKPRNVKMLPPVPPKPNSGCLNCGMMEQLLPMDAVIAVGFGSATLARNNRCIWFERADDEKYMTVAEAEELAKLSPDADWRIEYFGPLSEKEYQRQGEGKWVLIRTGMGFA